MADRILSTLSHCVNCKVNQIDLTWPGAWHWLLITKEILHLKYMIDMHNKMIRNDFLPCHINWTLLQYHPLSTFHFPANIRINQKFEVDALSVADSIRIIFTTLKIWRERKFSLTGSSLESKYIAFILEKQRTTKLK